MTTTPQVHCLVTLTDLHGRQFRSRIEDIGDGTLALARPLDLPVEHEFGIGAPVQVSWPDRGGVVTVSTELLETQLPGPLGLWLVRVLEPYQVQQRRQFVRVPAHGPVQLSLRDATSGAPSAQLTARMVRLSEAALRCALAQQEADGISPQDQATVGFTFGGQQFQFVASVLKLEPAAREKAIVELVLVFQIEENEAATLRRLVFAEQVRLRNEAPAAAGTHR